jgi:hypothetical protein
VGLRLGLCERFVIADEAHPIFLGFKENNRIRGRKRNNSSWQTTLADRKHECCQELELILSSKIQVEACIPQPAPVVTTVKPLCPYTCTQEMFTFGTACKTVTAFRIILKCIGSTVR